MASCLRTIVTLASLLTIFAPAQALAHARLLRSEPSLGAVLASPPARLRLVFSGLVERRFGRFVLITEDGKATTLRGDFERPGQATELAVPLPALAAGRYHVYWNVVARDSHRVEGAVSFTVR